MSRINTNVAALQTIHKLTSNQSELSRRLERLSTGLRINRGQDDPSGLIASESLRAESRALNAAIENSTRANNVLATAAGALSEVSSLLLEIRGLVNSAANEGALSDTEIQANQLQIDAIVDSIDRIASTTQFNGKKLLNGDLAYTTSGVSSANIASLQLFSVQRPEGQTLPLTVQVTQSAQTARLTVPANGTSGLSSNGLLPAANSVTLEVRGVSGAETFTFTGGTSNSAIRDSINRFKDSTGVSASLSGNAIRFNSLEYGSSQFVSVRALSGTFTVNPGDAGDTQDAGRDVGVRINGQTANGNGKRASLRTAGIDIVADLTTTFATTLNASTTFGVKGGGAGFAIGPEINSAGLVSVGIPAIAPSSLGDVTNGFLESLRTGGAASVSGGHYVKAERIVRTAIEQVAVLAGRLGAFQKDQIDTNINSRRVALENVTASESSIRDADLAIEVAQLTRAQILVQSTVSTLGVANQTPQAILGLLRNL